MTANSERDLLEHPLFFERNRVHRVYQGGKLFHDFFYHNESDPPYDNDEPEEWVASDVKAINAEERRPNEGLSRVLGTDVYLNELVARYPEEMLGGKRSLGVLVKVLDSAVRLPIQVHPDRAFSRKHLQSEYGKAEAWIILATRENASLYFGFKEELTRDVFEAACQRSETERDCMEPLLNRVMVQPGDVYFIPAKMVHAIGAGCLILEVQEPTDFTIQPEAWCGDHHLSEFDKFIGIPTDLAMECFDFSFHGSAALDIAKVTPKELPCKPGVCAKQLIGPEDTDCFGVTHYAIDGGSLDDLAAPAVYVVCGGSGSVSMDGGWQHPLHKGDYFLIPACCAGKCSVQGQLELVQCSPSAV